MLHIIITLSPKILTLSPEIITLLPQNICYVAQNHYFVAPIPIRYLSTNAIRIATPFQSHCSNTKSLSYHSSVTLPPIPIPSFHHSPTNTNPISLPPIPIGLPHTNPIHFHQIPITSCPSLSHQYQSHSHHNHLSL